MDNATTRGRLDTSWEKKRVGEGEQKHLKDSTLK